MHFLADLLASAGLSFFRMREASRQDDGGATRFFVEVVCATEEDAARIRAWLAAQEYGRLPVEARAATADEAARQKAFGCPF